MRTVYRLWTPEEVRKLEDLVGIYDATTIGLRLKRSRDSVRRKMRSLNLTSKSSQIAKGLPPVQFAEMIGVDKQIIWHWARVGILPKMKLPEFQRIGKKEPDWVLIDDSKIESWLMTGYVYHRDIKPTDHYYADMVRRVRKKLDFEWISSCDVQDCLNITAKQIQAWYYRHSFPRLVFYCTGMSISMYNRNAIIEWCMAHPRQVKPTRVRALQYYGIGKGLDQ